MLDQRNLLLAVVLSLAILLIFEMFLAPEWIPPQAPQTTETTQPQQAGSAPSPVPGTVPGSVPGPALGGLATAGMERPTALEQSARVEIENASVFGSISLTGGRLDDLVLSKYRETVEPDSPNIILLHPIGVTQPYYTDFGWSAGDSGVATPKPDTQWQSHGNLLTPDRPVTLWWDNGQGLRFERTYAIDDDYMFEVTQRVINSGTQAVTLSPYGLVSRTGTPDILGFYILHEGPIGVFNNTLEEIDYSDVQDDGVINYETTGGWIGITDKYWQVALIPDQQKPVKARFVHEVRNEQDKYQSDYLYEPIAIPAGGTAEVTSRLFAGAKEVLQLDGYRDNLGIARFDRSVDFGWFYFLTKPLFYALHYIAQMVGNFGVAILILTVFIKIVFFPLANKSYAAMAKMRKVQPEMLKLRERYGDDKQRLNQEMMALYKREGANPMSGCLPIVIQIPVFFALYKVLFVTIEMRHAPFFGWIQDLSARDPTSILNGFGLFPWGVPDLGALEVISLGIWPILMGLTMYLQQKLNPQPADPLQAKIFLFMPIIFTFLLATFPAGLVIYWTWNNLLSIIQQAVIMKRAGVPLGNPAAPSNPGKT